MKRKLRAFLSRQEKNSLCDCGSSQNAWVGMRDEERNHHFWSASTGWLLLAEAKLKPLTNSHYRAEIQVNYRITSRMKEQTAHHVTDINHREGNPKIVQEVHP